MLNLKCAGWHRRRRVVGRNQTVPRDLQWWRRRPLLWGAILCRLQNPEVYDRGASWGSSLQWRWPGVRRFSVDSQSCRSPQDLARINVLLFQTALFRAPKYLERITKLLSMSHIASQPACWFHAQSDRSVKPFSFHPNIQSSIFTLKCI